MTKPSDEICIVRESPSPLTHRLPLLLKGRMTCDSESRHMIHFSCIMNTWHYHVTRYLSCDMIKRSLRVLEDHVYMIFFWPLWNIFLTHCHYTALREIQVAQYVLAVRERAGHRCCLPLVSYESIMRDLNKRLIFKCRCDTRLKTKTEGSTRLTYTRWRKTFAAAWGNRTLLSSVTGWHTNRYTKTRPASDAGDKTLVFFPLFFSHKMWHGGEIVKLKLSGVQL